MRKLFYLFMVAMCATMFTACSKDDDKDPLDDNGGNGSKEGMITMIAESYKIGGHIETFNEGDIITIDWGDGTVEEFKSVEEYDDWDEDGEDEIHYVISIDDYVKHEYSNRNPHIVTIKGKIKYLDCQNNNLTSLNVSGCTALTGLECNNSNLTSLNVSGCTALRKLDCHYNNLTSLDVSGCTALTGLECDGNNLTSLDVSGCTALTWLNCEDNNLTSLDISKNTALTELSCSDNNLTSLDISGCTALTELYCSYNNLTSSALNQIFRDLPQGKTVDDGYSQSSIFIYDNPGTDTCDKSIAENKGWDV